MEYMLEKMAFSIAEENYKFSPVIEGVLYPEQIDHIAFLLKKYENSPTSDPKVSDYKSNNVELKKNPIPRKYEKNYCLFDQEKRVYYLIALNNGRIIDTNAAKAEKAILLEEYSVLSNSLKSSADINLFLATTYNRYGEGHNWAQEKIRRFFAKDELLISKDFWNFVCKSEDGYDVVIDEYTKHTHLIVDALNTIKTKYLSPME